MTLPAAKKPQISHRRRWRSLKNRLARYTVTAGGISVIIAIALIFFYLLWVVLPLFDNAAIQSRTSYTLDPTAETLHLAVDETGTLGLRYTPDGQVAVFSLASGELQKRLPLALDSAQISSFSPINPADNSFAIGTDDGRVLIGRHDFEASFANGERTLHPVLKYPLGKKPLVLDKKGRAITAIAARFNDNSAIIAGVLADGQIKVASFALQENFLTGKTTLARKAQWTLTETLFNGETARYLLIDPFQKWLYAAGESGNLLFFRLTAKGPQLIERVDLTQNQGRLASLRFLIGGTSLLAGTSQGRISQWFPVRQSPNHFSLTNVRDFTAADSAILDIAPEHRRKGFIATTADGQLGLYHTTSNQVLLTRKVSDQAIEHVAISARGNTLLTQSGDKIHLWSVDNDHPEISWSALWGQVWYESYPEPRYIWQSSAATSDFEPKFSLMPLVFGTLKAAFYAMLFAVPL
ncbi:MAG TPA: phosphate ABC transporter permease, partial [Gammaproteobacteria bacterium]|nr:phosphate ABC transporter permease [Gammaproteobacteria bacterium]